MKSCASSGTIFTFKTHKGPVTKEIRSLALVAHVLHRKAISLIEEEKKYIFNKFFLRKKIVQMLRIKFVVVRETFITIESLKTTSESEEVKILNGSAGVK